MDEARRDLGKKIVVAAASLLLTASVTGCGNNSSGTQYWEDQFTGGARIYLSTHVDGGSIAGYAQYTNGTFQHYNGTKSADGTFEIAVFAGSTATFDGGKLTLVDSENHSFHYHEVDRDAYSAAGGPG